MPLKEKVDSFSSHLWRSYNSYPNPFFTTINKYECGGLFSRVPPGGSVISQLAFSQRLCGKVFRVVVDQVRVHGSPREPQAREVMAFLGFFFRRQLPPSVCHFARITKLFQPPLLEAPLRRLHGPSRLRVAEKGPSGNIRAPEQQYQLTDLDKADALVGPSRGHRSRARIAFALKLLSFSFQAKATG